MPAHITLVHGDPIFAGSLALALRSEGHEVQTFTDPGFVVPPPQSTDGLEITITQATGRYRGLRIRVTGLPRGEPYAGPLGQFLADPVDVAGAIAAVRSFAGQGVPQRFHPN